MPGRFRTSDAVTTIQFDQSLFDAAAHALCDVGRELHRRGQVPATSSNFSVRLNEQCFAVTRSGPHKGRLTPADFLVADMAGQPVTDGKPSAETLLHCQLYQHDAAIGAVLHSHSPAATVLSRLLPDTCAIVLRGYELQKAFAGTTTHEAAHTVPIYANSQDIAALAATVERAMREGFEPPAAPGYIIRGHGIYAWGRDLAEADRHLEALDYLLTCELEELRIRR